MRPPSSCNWHGNSTKSEHYMPCKSIQSNWLVELSSLCISQFNMVEKERCDKLDNEYHSSETKWVFQYLIIGPLKLYTESELKNYKDVILLKKCEYIIKTRNRKTEWLAEGLLGKFAVVMLFWHSIKLRWRKQTVAWNICQNSTEMLVWLSSGSPTVPQ